jgi:hypothetical protein
MTRRFCKSLQIKRPVNNPLRAVLSLQTAKRQAGNPKEAMEAFKKRIDRWKVFEKELQIFISRFSRKRNRLHIIEGKKCVEALRELGEDFLKINQVDQECCIWQINISS